MLWKFFVLDKIKADDWLIDWYRSIVLLALVDASYRFILLMSAPMAERVMSVYIGDQR